VDAPIFTPNACEHDHTLFETQYFDQKAYLTQSGQLYMEAAAMVRQGPRSARRSAPRSRRRAAT
jgi:aspartyl/asparaginyl-tRNA synthetase